MSEQFLYRYQYYPKELVCIIQYEGKRFLMVALNTEKRDIINMQIRKIYVVLAFLESYRSCEFLCLTGVWVGDLL